MLAHCLLFPYLALFFSFLVPLYIFFFFLFFCISFLLQLAAAVSQGKSCFLEEKDMAHLFALFCLFLYRCVKTILASTLTGVHSIFAFSFDDWSYWVVMVGGVAGRVSLLLESLSRGAREVPKLASPFHPNNTWYISLKAINGQATLKSWIFSDCSYPVVIFVVNRFT